MSKRLLSIIVCCALILSALPVFVVAESNELNTVLLDNVDGNYFTYGEVLYQTDFEDETVGERPFGWSGGEIPSYAWSQGGASISMSVVENSEYGKVLSLGSTNADLFVSAPEINTRNYVYETTVKIAGTNNAAFGPANFMQGGAMNADGAVAVAVRTKNAAADHRYFSKALAGTAGISEGTFTMPFEKPLNGEVIKFKLVSLNGKNYFYYNNTLVASFPQPAGNETTDCVGFYGSNEYFHVIDLKITAVTAVDYKPEVVEIEGNKVLLGEEILNTDFEEYETGTLPDGFEIGTPDHFWKMADSSEGNAVIAEAQGYGKVLSTGGYNRDVVVHFGDIDAKNYIFELSGYKRGSEDASCGLVNLMPGGINNSETAMIHVIYSNKSTGVPYYSGKSTANYMQQGKVTLSDFEYAKPVANELFTLKLISLNGVTYFYYNNKLAASYEQPLEWGLEKDGLGYFFSGDYVSVTEVKVTEIYELDYAVDSATLLINGTQDLGMSFNLSFNKSDYIYKNNYEEDYTYSKDTPLKFGLLVSDCADYEELTVETENITNVIFNEFSQNENSINFNYTIDNIPDNMKDKTYRLRPYAIVGYDYYYCDEQIYCPALVANNVYITTSDKQIKDALDFAFKDSKVFVGKDAKEITFTIFADFHYHEGRFISNISDLNSIFDRANATNSAFVLSAGDITNDMKGSPELVEAFKNNKYNLPAYNVYGNHELESAGNTMQLVTPTLTNDENVVWGTADGKIAADGSIGYYYFENGGFRVICLDTNYSFNPTTNEWEHNKTSSWSWPTSNTNGAALGPVQLDWLDTVLTDAANQNIPCIVMSHHDFSSINGHSSDAKAVRDLYRKANTITPGTVILSLNGHIHTDTQSFEDGVFYFDVNTTRNLWWQSKAMDNFNDSQLITREFYDEQGNLIETKQVPITELSSYKESAFSEDPLSAVVTVNENGIITVEGMESDWLFDFIPTGTYLRTVPYISSGTYFDTQLCHIWSDEYDSDETHHWLGCVNDFCKGIENCDCKNYGEHIDLNADGNCDVCQPTIEPAFEDGDINGDGFVNTADLAILKKLVAGLIEQTNEDVKNPDVNGDTFINTTDLALLKKKVAGL